MATELTWDNRIFGIRFHNLPVPARTATLAWFVSWTFAFIFSLPKPLFPRFSHGLLLFTIHTNVITWYYPFLTLPLNVTLLLFIHFVTWSCFILLIEIITIWKNSLVILLGVNKHLLNGWLLTIMWIFRISYK